MLRITDSTTRSDHPNWLRMLQDLWTGNRPKDVIGLAAYYPAHWKKDLLLFFSHLKLKQFRKAENIAGRYQTDLPEEATDFAGQQLPKRFNIEKTLQALTDGKHNYAADWLFDCYFSTRKTYSTVGTVFAAFLQNLVQSDQKPLIRKYTEKALEWDIFPDDFPGFFYGLLKKGLTFDTATADKLLNKFFSSGCRPVSNDYFIALFDLIYPTLALRDKYLSLLVPEQDKLQSLIDSSSSPTSLFKSLLKEVGKPGLNFPELYFTCRNYVKTLSPFQASRLLMPVLKKTSPVNFNLYEPILHTLLDNVTLTKTQHLLLNKFVAAQPVRNRTLLASVLAAHAPAANKYRRNRPGRAYRKGGSGEISSWMNASEPSFPDAVDLHFNMTIDTDNSSRYLWNDFAKTAEKETGLQPHYSNIYFPSYCVWQQRAVLAVNLSDLVKNDTPFHETIYLPAKSATPVRLQVAVTSPAFEIEEKERIQEVTYDFNEEKTLYFFLNPIKPGKQSIEIEIYQLQPGSMVRIGYYQIETQVKKSMPRNRKPAANSDSCVAGAGASLTGNLPPEAIVYTLENMSPATDTAGTNTLHVTYKEGSISYDFSGRRWEHFIPEFLDAVTRYLQELNAFLSEIVCVGNPEPESWENIQLSMQGWGNDLVEKLLPYDLKQEIEKLPADSTLIISTNEPWIPWELFCDENGFWGQRFVLARYPRLNPQEAKIKESRDRPAASCTELTVNRIVHVIGGSLPETEERRCAGLFSTCPVGSVELLEKKKFSEFHSAFTSSDLIHLTCHGIVKDMNPILQICGDTTSCNNLSLTNINRLPGDRSRFVFSNSCSSNRALVTFGHFNSFGWTFYIHGIPVFIGTLGIVPAKYAIEFAEIVYRQLFGYSTSIGQALLRAKREAGQHHNLYWLLYSLIGNPDLRIITRKKNDYAR